MGGVACPDRSLWIESPAAAKAPTFNRIEEGRGGRSAMIAEECRKKGSCIIVGVKLAAASREVLTWALVKVARPEDRVIALHVVRNSEVASKEQSSSSNQLTSTFHSIAAVYEGFCNLKQIDLQVKISHGSAVRKVLVEEAKLCEASKVILGARKHNGLRSPISLAKYCVKKLPCTCSVLVVDNGKVIFEKYARQLVSGTAGASRVRLLNGLQWSMRSKSCKVLNKVLSNVIEDHLPAVEHPFDATTVSSPGSHNSAEHGNVPCQVLDTDVFKNFLVSMPNGCKYSSSEMNLFKSCIHLRQGCSHCTSNIQTLAGKDEKHVEHESKGLPRLSSYDSFQTVSNTSGHASQEEEACTSTSLISTKPADLTSGPVLQRGESPSGWPLLHRAISLNKVPSPRSRARQMSVVEWALQLPSRHAQMNEEIRAKAEIARKVCNQHHKAQSSNEETLLQAFSQEVGFPCSHQDEPKGEEPCLTKKIELLCENKTCRQFTYQELQSATSSFSAENFIGRGGWSQVYRGFLPDGQSVAVKILNCSPKEEQEFLLEIEIITTLQHKHIVSLIGYCVEGPEGPNRSLVYNFVSRGNLEDNLHARKDKPVLPWTERLKVAVGVAEALAYLHDGCSRSVIHRDVKSSNILLSEDFEPQLSDFGLAKWAPMSSSHITCSDVVGTFGYLAPEYFMYGKVNEKTDVFSFGVVLLELITGRKPVNTTNPKGQENLVMWARQLLEDGNIKELADPRLENVYDTNEMQRMMLAAALCIRQQAQFRPRMSRILNLLLGEDDIANWTRCQLTVSKDTDASDEEEYATNFEDCGIQTHLTLAMLGVDDDAASVSSMDHSLDLLHEKRTLEDYLRGRCSRSSSFD